MARKAQGKDRSQPTGDNPSGYQEDVLTRARSACAEKTHWQTIYDDATRFAIPMRNPGGEGNRREFGAEVMDMTAMDSTMHFAGQLQQGLFPPGQPPGHLTPGVFVRNRLPESELEVFGRKLREVEGDFHPYFMTGDFDSAVHEMCIDLSLGTGALLVHPGSHMNQPLRFACIPLKELAIEVDLFGDPTLISWKRRLKKRAIRQAMPKAKFPDNYGESGDDGYDVLEQIFYRKSLGQWGYSWGYMCVVQEGKHIAGNAWHRYRRIATPRYYRVSGEAYGRGPLLFALPSIKTLNKAHELAFRAAAIQMLGIWGYRATGTFNPETISLDAGAFWPMQSTGGMLGADVSRLDAASGSLSVAELIIGDMKDQIRSALLDERLKPQRGTPASASEIAARIRQKGDVTIGAFGRLVRETAPVIIPAAIDILNEKRLMSFKGANQINELMIGLEVRSPMAAALNAQRVQQAIEYFEMVAAVDPENIDYHVNREALLMGLSELMQINPDWKPTGDQKKQIKQAQEAAQAAMIAMQMAQAAQGGGGAEGALEAAA
jgi:hypothetical protein